MRDMKYRNFRNSALPVYETGGAGFITEKIRRTSDDERLRIPELSSAFLPLFWFAEKDITNLLVDGDGVYISSENDVNALGEGAEHGKYSKCSKYSGRMIPLIYRETVSGIGNYRVEIEIDNTNGNDDEVMIFLTRRRLYYRGKISGGEVFRRSFDVNVCDFIPRGYRNEFEGNSIDVAILAKEPRLTSLKIEKLCGDEDVPVIWIAGDSTLTDQSADYPYCPSTSYSGWGQMLSAFVSGGAAVSNHAHSGLTTHSFVAGGHDAIVQRNIRPGDWFILQFAHNDQKVDFLKADGGYRERIIEYAAKVRAKGALPIVVTPLARNSWLAGGEEYNDLLFDYDLECKKLGEELGIPVIGLHDFMMDIIKREGVNGAKRYFYPGDYTHTNDPGAYMCAEYIASELSRLSGEYAKIAALINKGFGKWDAPSGMEAPTPPSDYKSEENTVNVSENEAKNTEITRAEAADMIIKAAHYFITNVYNDMYTDIVGHEWYAGAVQCAYQNGILPTELIRNRKFCPEEKITLGDLIVMAVLAYTSRNERPKTLPEVSVKCEKWMEDYVGIALALGLIKKDDDLSSHVTGRAAAEICAKMKL